MTRDHTVCITFQHHHGSKIIALSHFGPGSIHGYTMALSGLKEAQGILDVYDSELRHALSQWNDVQREKEAQNV